MKSGRALAGNKIGAREGYSSKCVGMTVTEEMIV